ncbi:hypothetical protein [Adlercreutzia muris]|uniref:hypothetical protein n=1 Tax=Adlercreutzia muris TaxID=1796610 RepID=UPI0035189F60
MRSNRLRIIAAVAAAFALAGALGACAPQAAPTDGEPAAVESEGTAEAAAFTWSVDSDCGTCHGDDVASFDDASCPASQHAAMKDQCMTCHNDPNMERAHAKVTLDSEKKKATLKRTVVARDTCLASGCHDMTEIAADTADVTVLTDKNGTTVNPHDLPESEDHASINCSSCHKLHTADTPAEAAPATCRNCHHADVYECNTCHDH